MDVVIFRIFIMDIVYIVRFNIVWSVKAIIFVVHARMLCWLYLRKGNVYVMALIRAILIILA